MKVIENEVNAVIESRITLEKWSKYMDEIAGETA